jgi:hypothetical protein
MCATNELPNSDTINIFIEDDGTITIRTAGISNEVHKTAEEFLQMLAKELGATVETHQHETKAHVHHTTNTQQTVKIGG